MAAGEVYYAVVVCSVFFLFLSGGLKLVSDGSDSSACSLKIYLSLSTSLEIPW